MRELADLGATVLSVVVLTSLCSTFRGVRCDCSVGRYSKRRWGSSLKGVTFYC